MIGRPPLFLISLFVFALSSFPDASFAHGSVTPEDDLCIIRIGYYRAHFKIYLPRTREHKDFCEDIPGTGEVVFVMEYEHSGLGEVPIDFRVIRNVTGKGTFAILEDVEKIGNIDDVTLFHHRAAVQPDVFTYLQQFDEQGEFVGIVTVRQPDTGQVYTAVFPFEVGYTGIPTWAWFIIVAIVLQINFLWMNGSLGRWRKFRSDSLVDGSTHA
ncbi:MAG: hypothetical protein O3A13_07385 [Proteobacteria bacterium]|nr:hypothetical protein [Pseudomonadota bacterium]MDA0993442.1 hypothetical protein [Pseudomonadota bacterium]